MKMTRELWCRGSDCKHHPVDKKMGRRRSIALRCLRCKRFVTRDLYEQKGASKPRKQTE